MFNFKEYLLSEGKQVGTLYHFTSINSLLKLIGTNFKFNANNNYVSFTRDYQLPKTVPRDSSFAFSKVRVDIDGDKISNHYKVLPILGLKDENDPDIFNNTKQRINKTVDRESETVIISKSKNYFLKDYIKGIQVKDVDVDTNIVKHIQQYCEHNNIPLKLIRHFTLKEEITKQDVDNQLDLELYALELKD